MSDTPRTDAARRKLSSPHELGYKDVAIMDEQCVEFERELNEANADRLRLREALLKTGHGGPGCLCDSTCKICQAISATFSV